MTAWRMEEDLRVYGAWLYRGVWDGQSPPPAEGWKLLTMKPGRFQEAPQGMEPKRGQVLLLMHGESCTVITPDQVQGQ